MEKKRRKYDKGFKRESVELTLTGGKSIQAVADELGISGQVLGRWHREYLADKEDAFPGKGHLKPTEEAYRKLQRDFDDMRTQRDILKKAVAIFSRGPR